MLNCNQTHMIEKRNVFALLVGALLLAPASAAQAPPPISSKAAEAGSATASFVGCYQISLGRWWPWSFGEDTVFVTPPSRIQLLSQRGTQAFEKNGFIIWSLPHNKGAMPGTRRVFSYWSANSANGAELTWTDGLTGVFLALHKRGNDLRGWAHPHFDFPHFIPRTAHVEARKMPCDEPENGPTAP
jgi:hypothetical protein